MWFSETSLIQPGVSKVEFRREDGDVLTFRSFFEQLQTDSSLIEFTTEKLLETQYNGFFWELPPLTIKSAENAFECVVVDGTQSLSHLTANPVPFANQFAEVKSPIAIFKNLGGDATLIAPLPIENDSSAYSHFAAFLRSAPADQIREFWRSVGKTALENLSSTPFWLSTAGLGVSWLHLRLDSRPKYYRFAPYKTF